MPAPLGKLLSPQHGIWQNAENTHEDFTADLKFPQLSGKVSVYLDAALCRTFFAEQENDAYFVQGYIHANFVCGKWSCKRLRAGGRASEIIGEKALNHDREFRRLGMVYAAEIAEKEMGEDPAIKAECDAYTAGVNAYINTLTGKHIAVGI
ncbi:MAG: penicillin acylase family protein [Ferruginibacter sp.]